MSAVKDFSEKKETVFHSHKDVFLPHNGTVKNAQLEDLDAHQELTLKVMNADHTPHVKMDMFGIPTS